MKRLRSQAFLNLNLLNSGDALRRSETGELTIIKSDGSQEKVEDYSEIDKEVSKLLAEVPMRLLREERNQRLSETDWWVLPDRTASQEQKDYRQALRDLPSTAEPQLDEQGNLINVTWPTKPE